MTGQEINEFTVKISQANKTGLIVIMYEMAIKYIDDGMMALENNNIEASHIFDWLKFCKKLTKTLQKSIDIML